MNDIGYPFLKIYLSEMQSYYESWFNRNKLKNKSCQISMQYIKMRVDTTERRFTIDSSDNFFLFEALLHLEKTIFPFFTFRRKLHIGMAFV